MIRVEVIANRSVQEDFFERLGEHNLASTYTLFPEVQGSGSSGQRRGDHVWPEENFVFVTYCSKSEGRTIAAIVEDLKLFFPNEGIKFFATRCAKL